MSNFFKKKKAECPVSEDTRIWMENTFIWLMNKYGEETLMKMKTLKPTQDDFPVSFNASRQMGVELLDIIARQMEIDPEELKLDFYDQKISMVQGESNISTILQLDDSADYFAGVYAGQNEEGKFSILIEQSLLKNTDALIATLAHELAHVKIIGKGLLRENDEYLTDLLTVFFGIGIFGANAAFTFFSTSKNWGYQGSGYLTQQEWAYALALYAYIRYETNPDWFCYLAPNIKSDFQRSALYIDQNKDKVLV